MRSISLLLTLMICVAPSAWADGDLVPFRTYYPRAHFSPHNSGTDGPLSVALSSEKEWQNLWDRIEPRLSRDELQRKPHPAPKIDFDRFTLLVVALGSRPTGGFSVVFHAVREYPSRLDVTAVELKPGADCVVTTAVTHPIAFVLIPHTQKVVHFDVRNAAIACGK